MAKEILYPLFKLFIILFVLLIAVALYVGWRTRPVAEHKRNLSETDTKIEVEINDKSEVRTPIIRTYKEEDYNDFDEDKIKKIMDSISGNIEGDIPAVEIRDDKNILYISFVKDKNKIDPDSIPSIEIQVPKDSADTAPYTKDYERIISDNLTRVENNKYSYKIERYKTQHEKYFMEYNIIKIYYTIDGEKYISLFGLNSTNADEGTDFFENEDLETPIEPEI